MTSDDRKATPTEHNESIVVTPDMRLPRSRRLSSTMDNLKRTLVRSPSPPRPSTQPAQGQTLVPPSQTLDAMIDPRHPVAFMSYHKHDEDMSTDGGSGNSKGKRKALSHSEPRTEVSVFHETSRTNAPEAGSTGTELYHAAILEARLATVRPSRSIPRKVFVSRRGRGGTGGAATASAGSSTSGVPPRRAMSPEQSSDCFNPGYTVNTPQRRHQMGPVVPQPVAPLPRQYPYWSYTGVRILTSLHEFLLLPDDMSTGMMVFNLLTRWETVRRDMLVRHTQLAQAANCLDWNGIESTIDGATDSAKHAMRQILLKVPLFGDWGHYIDRSRTVPPVKGNLPAKLSMDKVRKRKAKPRSSQNRQEAYSLLSQVWNVDD
ncbi:hypothetical protein QBC47DRAFT_399853 [Echria macrotheca]|uniref:Uncharacterized protein n=1 Tax=Echria macrotheca TaxID=438768 RepID=A0AAJ0F828_9PEZI|nr:hypothetical protein QBC47DRAFT_399853 [Echria macrotheca]